MTASLSLFKFNVYVAMLSLALVDNVMRVGNCGGVRNIVMIFFHWVNSTRTLGCWNNMSASRIGRICLWCICLFILTQEEGYSSGCGYLKCVLKGLMLCGPIFLSLLDIIWGSCDRKWVG